MPKPATDSFTADEYRRMRRTLHRHFKVDDKSNITDVGFGLPIRDEQVDRGAGMVVTFFVCKKKANPSRKDFPVPRHVELRLKRGHHFETFTFPTDVIELPRFTQTGRLATHRRDHPNDLTAGVVVTWAKSGVDDPILGIVTVRHGLEAGRGRFVRFRVHPTLDESDPEFVGTICWKSPTNSVIDAAVIEVERKDLERAQILKPNQPLTSHPPRSLDLIANDSGRNGRSKRTDLQPTFLVQLYLPKATRRIANGLGPVEHLVLVRSEVREAFRPTTSGSAWVVDLPRDDGRDIAIQLGADEATYQLGVGQALSAILDAVDAGLANVDEGLAGTLRMIATF